MKKCAVYGDVAILNGIALSLNCATMELHKLFDTSYTMTTFFIITFFCSFSLYSFFFTMIIKMVTSC
uniref:Uncharacterized protein n=1 Tax=Anguilla anguilla TaxID=7936 RepID=A0A0E9WYF6_ANGAN